MLPKTTTGRLGETDDRATARARDGVSNDHFTVITIQYNDTTKFTFLPSAFNNSLTIPALHVLYVLHENCAHIAKNPSILKNQARKKKSKGMERTLDNMCGSVNQGGLSFPALITPLRF